MPCPAFLQNERLAYSGMLAKHDIVAIGGSAGSLDALIQIVGSLPSGLPAAVFMVVHLSWIPKFSWVGESQMSDKNRGWTKIKGTFVSHEKHWFC